MEVDPDQDVIVLVNEASGDEEVGALGAKLKGVILAHSLPLLSHLGKSPNLVSIECVCQVCLSNVIGLLFSTGSAPVY